MSFKEILDHFKSEGQVIKNAPFSFVSCVLILGIMIFIGVDWHYDGIINDKNGVIEQKEATITTVSTERDSANRENDKLTKDNDWLRTYRGKDAPPLKQNALTLARQLHDYIKDWKDTDAPNVKEMNMQKFLQRFGLRDQIMRDDLDQSGQQSDDFDKVMYNFTGSYEEVRIIADSIEKLANKLPD